MTWARIEGSRSSSHYHLANPDFEAACRNHAKLSQRRSRPRRPTRACAVCAHIEDHGTHPQSAWATRTTISEASA